MKVHEAITLWADNPSKNKDATYSVQLFEDEGTFYVQAQFGRRGATQMIAKFRGSEYHYEGTSYVGAKAQYDDLVWKKQRGGYTKPHKTILPFDLQISSSKPVKPNKKQAGKLNEFMTNAEATKKSFGLEALWKKS